MVELPLIFMTGLLGSSHCLGMCGPFVLTLGSSAASSSANLRRQLVYSLGRVFTYSVLGAVAGYGGSRLSDAAPQLINLPAGLALLAGLFLVYQGLVSAGVLRKRTHTAGTPCLTKSMFAAVLTAPGYTSAFLAGLFTGFLPCGLLYGMLALATTTRSIGWGMAVMAVFAAGTVPLMVVAGWGGSLLSIARRQKIIQTAAWCLILTGAVTIVRGVGYLQFSTAPADAETAAACPFCVDP